MSSVPPGSDVRAEEDSTAAMNVSSTEPAAAGAVLTNNPSSATIAAAVAAALVAAGISGTTADNGKGNMASATASKKGKKGAKGKNFMQAEIDCMLELIEEHDMPLCNSKWQQVVDEHMMYFPDTDHNVDGLHCKFNALASKKVPTGDPFIPPDVKKAQKIRKELSKFSGLKTGSPEKMEINFNKINSKGGALDDDSLNFSSNLEEFKDSVEDLRSDSDRGNNKDDEDEDDDDDEVKIVARSNLRNMAAASSSKHKTTPMMRLTSPHPVVTQEFSSTTFSKRREDQRKSNKKRSLDEDDDDGN
jgi:hypothetical protein